MSKKLFLNKKEEKERLKEINKSIKIFTEKIKDFEHYKDYSGIMISGHKIIESMLILYFEKEEYPLDHTSISSIIRYSKNHDIFPQECIDFLDIMRTYRNKAAHGSKPDYELTKTYLKAFNYFILWFNEFYSTEITTDNPFKIHRLTNSIQKILKPSKENGREKRGVGIVVNDDGEEEPIEQINQARKLKNKSKTLQRKINKINNESKRLETKSNELEYENKNIERKYNDIKEISEYPINSYKEFERSKNDLSKINKEITLLDQKIKDIKIRIYEIDIENLKDDESAKTEKNKKELEKILIEHEDKLATLKIKKEQFEKINDDIKKYDIKEYDKIENEIEILESEKDKLNIKIEEVAKEKTNLKKEYYQFEKEIYSLHEKNRQYNYHKAKDNHELHDIDLDYYIGDAHVIPKKFKLQEIPKSENDSVIDNQINDEEIFNINMKTQNFSDYLEDMLRNITEEAIKEPIQEFIEQITEQLNRIEGKIDNILMKLDDVTSAIQSFSSRLIENSNSEEEIEKILKTFTDEYIENLSEYMEEKSKEREYNLVKRDLERSLGPDAWNKLTAKSQNFLITSKVMYNDFYMIEEKIDYSGVCLLVSKAIEEEMFKRFFTDFVNYSRSKYGTNYSKYHTALTYNGRSVLFPERFTMGSIAFVLCYRDDRNDTPAQITNNKKVLMEYCKDKIFPNEDETEIKKLLNEYGNKIEKIKDDYRNPSAHRNAIKRVNAEECFDLVLDIERLLKRMLNSFDY